MTLTTSQILEYIENNPGVSTQELARAGCSADGAVYDRAYHCTRVKIALLKKRGMIHRPDEHKPGHKAYWYVAGVEASPVPAAYSVIYTRADQ